MRVGLSLLTLVPGEIGGSETYARGLARGLADRELDVTAFVPSIAPDAGEGLPTEVVGEYRAARSAAGRLRAMTAARLAPGEMRDRFDGLDLVHYPLTVPVPAARGGRVAITLHDVQHLDLPRLFSRGERFFRRLAYDRAARRADAVIVPTTFVRDRVVDRLGIDPGSVHVALHGIDHAVFSPTDELREPFLLYPAKVWLHKNHTTLLQAFGRLRDEHPELRLVLTGAGTERFAGPAGVEARGVVPQTELVSLYRRTACLVFPSRYEGFGAPPLEAMACGAPVASSTAGSLPEVCGDAAVLFDPSDPAAVAHGVEEALARSQELSRLGLAHAATFTWDECARLHEDVYRATA